MVEKETLVALVRGLQQGEESAAAQLYELFQNDIYYFILKTVNNDKELAEDLTQDTFVEILETIGNLQEPAAFVTWSKQIAYHKCTAYFKKRKELLVDEDEDGYSVFDTVEEEREEFIPDAALDKEDLKQTILSMLNELPEEQRSALVLRYFNEIPVKEIAEIQGVTEGTVKSRLNYGRKALKQAAEDYEKKNGIKLRCVGILPLLLWLFRQYRIEKDLPLASNTAGQTFAVGEGIAKATAMAAGSASTVSSGAAAVTATKGAAAATAAGKTAVIMGGKMLAMKIIAAIVVVGVAISSIVIGISGNKDTDPIGATVVTTESVQGDANKCDRSAGHSWEDATCETPKICSVCGKEDGEALDHDWQETSPYYPKKCSACGKTECEVYGHRYEDHSMPLADACIYCHQLKPNIICPRCGRGFFESGVSVFGYSCNGCGYQIITAHGHNITYQVDNETGHQWTVLETVYCGDAVCGEYLQCEECDLNGFYEYEVVHQWETKEVYYCGENIAGTFRICTGCMKSEEIVHLDVHQWESYQEYDENGEVMADLIRCTICGRIELPF